MGKKLVRFDWAMKKLLRQKAHFGVLEGFLSELLKQDVVIKHIGESEGNKETEKDKFNRVDILVENDKGELILIELQVELEHDYFHRMLYGASKAITEYISAGQPYEKVKKIYAISIVYFELGQGLDYVYVGATHFVGMHQHDTLALSDKQKNLYFKDHVSQIFPEYYILKVNQFNDVEQDGLDEWIYLFKHSEIKPTFKAKGIQEASKIMDSMKLRPKQRKEYERYLQLLSSDSSHGNTLKAEIQFAHQQGEAIGREKGEAVGEKKKAFQIAANLLTEGIAIEMVAKLTGLSVAEVELIRNGMN
jgi:predicted transposase/invertase (TIGR01784 family)